MSAQSSNGVIKEFSSSLVLRPEWTQCFDVEKRRGLKRILKRFRHVWLESSQGAFKGVLVYESKKYPHPVSISKLWKD